jgi:hypothetical protein
MKTFFTKLFVHFEAISHPAVGWFSKKDNTVEKKKSGAKKAAKKSPSPDSLHVRGRANKKSNSSRRTLAP